MTTRDESRPKLPAHEVPGLGVLDVADLFEVSESTVRRWVSNGEIDYFKIGGLIRFAPSSIEKFINKSRVPADAS